MLGVKKYTVASAGVVSVFVLAAAPFFVASALTDTSTITATVNSVISVSSADTVSFSVTPTASGALSSDSDVVTVSTNATAGYTLSISSSDATVTMVNGNSDTIAASSNPYATPAALENNRWGYAVPGGNFDASYAAETNVEGSATKWSGMPALGSLQQIKTTASTATNDTTTIWYAVEATTAQPNGAYTEVVTYTAVADN